jgi:hypothetical protein
LEDIVKKYKKGELKNVRFELLCLIVYNETKVISGDCEDSIKKNIKKIIKDRCGSFNKTKFNIIDASLLLRINYVIFPIWKLDELLDDFQTKVGAK